jgi:hypothetical protein
MKYYTSEYRKVIQYQSDHWYLKFIIGTDRWIGTIMYDTLGGGIYKAWIAGVIPFEFKTFDDADSWLKIELAKQGYEQIPDHLAALC